MQWAVVFLVARELLHALRKGLDGLEAKVLGQREMFFFHK